MPFERIAINGTFRSRRNDGAPLKNWLFNYSSGSVSMRQRRIDAAAASFARPRKSVVTINNKVPGAMPDI